MHDRLFHEVELELVDGFLVLDKNFTVVIDTGRRSFGAWIGHAGHCFFFHIVGETLVSSGFGYKKRRLLLDVDCVLRVLEVSERSR